ncbi:unnamed protein product [Mytilus edulis]|uniref:Uncharacterized protein n=1 Tax=Mytilus edulis TaxID=6550 RepID=A0A8S3UIT4_MYTED|nr:unnamed protein product [Mytilus edulis]
MKQPTAPDLYPELPIEDGQNYRLQKITEIEKTLINERDKRKSLYKKYKRGVNVTDGVDTSLISTSMNKMAEGGYEFDNPEFKNNDYDEEEEETSFQDDEEFQNNINKEFEKSRDLSENDAKIQEGRAGFQRMLNEAPIRELDNIEIPLQEISTQEEGQELLETASNAETYVKEIETSFIEQGTSLINEETQTKMTKREMDGIIKAFTTSEDEIANNLAKLNETNKDLAKENAKLEQAKEDNDEFQIDRISSRIRELESERSARLEVININKEKLRSQVNRFKQTIHKMLNEDKTLGERIRTLFREQE